MILNRYELIPFLILLFVINLFGTALADSDDDWGGFLPSGQYYTILDPDGEVLLETGRMVYVEDQYLDSQNRLYEVIEVDAETGIARTEFVGEVELEVVPLTELRKALGLRAAKAEKGTMAIYHTHNAESYVPTDGTDSINGKGGIHQVGKAFAKALQERGIKIEYSEQLHLPHDRGAYRRSRETVLELLSKEPDAIFDVHRDAAPQHYYAVQLNDEWVTSVQFVVGRQNQNLSLNRQYAQSLKKISDELYPGLIKGIYFGRGNYNQDLSPLSLLLEAGAHTNNRSAAERGISLFAEVVDLYFYGPTAEAAGSEQNKTARRSIYGLVAFVSAGAVVFFVINSGGFSAAWKRMAGRFGRRRLK